MNPKKLKNEVLLLFIVLLSTFIKAQTGAEIDTVYDREGRKYSLSDLRINLNGKYGSVNYVNASYTCTAGYFNVFFAANCGMDNSTLLHQKRRQTVCEVLANISGMVNPSFVSATDKVNILVQDITAIIGPGASTLSTLGVCSSFISFPSTPTNPNPGIIDNLVYKTITTQQNAYNFITGPVISTAGAGNLYHAMISMNFANTGFIFNSDIAVLPGPSDRDLYTILLHEMTHSLGFSSMISSSGNSIYGPANNYFDRYDTFLKDHLGNSLVTTTNSCSSQLGYSFTSTTINVQPSCPTPTTAPTNSTNCSIANYYSSPTLTHMPVFTPNCYWPGSSLSHFEDQCYPLIGPPYGNDQYFVMSNALPLGAFKRYLKEEDRLVLCDLGYSLITTFTSNANSAPHTYTSSCSNPIVVGLNDGLSAPPFPTYTINTTMLSPVTINNILSNDLNATSYKCLYVALGTGTLSNTSGTGAFTYTPAYPGVHVLGYVPVGSNNIEGTVTWVYVNVAIPTVAACPAPGNSQCNLIFNGDFEQTQTVPLSTNTMTFAMPCGWSFAHGTPDYFHQYSPAGCGVDLPCNYFGYESDNVPGNKAFCGMVTMPGFGPGTWVSECIYTQLTSPLQPNMPYTLAFDVSLSEGWGNAVTPLQAYFATNTSFVNPANTGGGIFAASGPTVLLTTPVSFTQTNGWTHVSMNFTTGSSANLQYMALGNLFGVFTGVQTPLSMPVNSCFSNEIASLGGTAAYHFIDNVTLNKANLTATLTLPTSVCTTQTVNLTPLASPPGGIFTGPGVTCTGTNCIFNAATAGVGSHVISYSVTVPGTVCPFAGAAAINVVAPFTLSPSIVGTICPTAGQTRSLTVVPSPTASGFSYTWQPGNQIGQNIVVNPNVTTIYTVNALNGLCGNSATISVYVIPSVTATLPPVLCTGPQTIDLTGSLVPPTPTLGNWTATGLTGTAGVVTATDLATSHVWAYAPNTLTGPGIYTLTYVSTLFTGCSVTAQYTIEVRNTPTLTTNGPLSRCTNIPGYPALTLQATSTSTLPMTYTWNPGGLSGGTVAVSPTATTFYTVVGSDGYCLSVPNILEVTSNSTCCGGTTTGAPWQYITSGTIGTATLNGLYAINQNLVVNGNLKLNGEFYMAPNVTIKVLYNSSISTDYTFTVGPEVRNAKAHLLACNAMWNGISVETYGEVKFQDGDLIEDAKTAISSNNSQNNFMGTGLYEINLENVAFNRNKVGVSISNYTYTAAGGYGIPFKINTCVFTCRNFTYVPMYVNMVPAWPSYTTLTSVTTPTNPLATKYLMNNFTSANLKAPYTTEPANAGVYVFNSGRTTNPTLSNTTYTTINVGDNSVPYTVPGIFDNLNIGICALNSNVASFGNIFQNTRAIPITTANPYYPGTGISASNNNLYTLMYSNNYVNLTTTQNPTVNINRFYNCEYGVHLQNIFQLNMKYAEFSSTQSKTAPPGQLLYTGLWIEGNRFKEYFVNNNKFMNLAYGVVVSTYPGLFNITGAYQSGQLWGTINIRQNYFSAVGSPTVTSLGNNFMSLGVSCNNLILSKFPQPLGTGFYTVTPYNGLWIADNTFDRVYRGASVSNFNNGAFGKFVANNTISIVPDHVTTNFQFGAAAQNNYNAVYNSNYISGYTVTPSTTLSGMYFSMNTTSAAKCNTLYILPRGIEYAGLNSGTQWRINTMTLNARGMQLSNNGIIGLQGGTNSPADNYWAGTWATSFYSTWTDNTSYASNSKFYKRTLTGYDPTNNLGAFAANSYANTSNMINANNSANWPPCVVGVPSKGPGGSKSGVALKIANGTMPYLGTYTSETEEINRFLLYDDLLGDTCLLNSCPTLQSFFGATQTSEIGQLNQIEETLVTGDYVTASGLVASFVPMTNIQSNYLQFYDLCIRFLDSTQVLSSQDSVDIDVLAHKCPFTDGAIIYNARALNVLVNGSLFVYNDNGCDGSSDSEEGGGEFGRMARNVNEPKKEIQDAYKLFPNPAKDILYLLGVNENETVGIEIKDVNNRIIVKSNIQMINYSAHVKLDLINGVYFVSLVNQNSETIVKKLVIAK